MRRQIKTTLSTIAAVAMLGCAVMLSVSSAEGPYRHGGENAFNGPPLGHPDKALIQTQWLAECDAEPAPRERTAFDWGLDERGACPKCGFSDSRVAPVVLDVPELLGACDATAIDVIKRKLGINAFRGSIFEEPGFPAAQLFINDAPPVLKTHVCDPYSGTCAQSSQACATLCDALDCGKSNVATSTAVNASHEVCGASCDKTCDTACAGEKAVVGVATAALPGAPRGKAYASSIEVDSVAALRRASLELDEAAMRLEVSDRYAEADALREAAHHLRVKARDLKRLPSAGSTAAVDQPPFVPESTGYSAPKPNDDEPQWFTSPVGLTR
jgi:hypothetical protein